MNIYEMYGRLEEKFQREANAHGKSIALIHQLIKGETKIDQIEAVPNGWQLKPEQPTETPCNPSTTATPSPEPSPPPARRIRK